MTSLKSVCFMHENPLKKVKIRICQAKNLDKLEKIELCQVKNLDNTI